MLVDGKPVHALTSRAIDYFSGRVVAAPEKTDPPLPIERNRFVTEGVHEDIVVSNHSLERRELELELRFGADFADVLEAQTPGAHENRTEISVGERSVLFAFDQDGFRRGTRLRFNRRGELREDGVTFRVAIEPHWSWKLCVDITPLEGSRARPPLLRCDSFGAEEPEMPVTLSEWLERAPELEADSEDVVDVYRRSLVDLAALRIRPREEDLRWALPAGGVPWFLAVFGRDSLIASYEALPFQPTLARATLEALAETQGTERDDFRDAEPGKILHELDRRARGSRRRRLPRVREPLGEGAPQPLLARLGQRHPVRERADRGATDRDLRDPGLHVRRPPPRGAPRT